MSHQGVVCILEAIELSRLRIGDLQTRQQVPRAAEGAGPGFGFGGRDQGFGLEVSGVRGQGVSVKVRGVGCRA